GEIPRQLFAQLLDIVGGRVMFGLKRDQNFRIEIAYGFAVAIRQIDSAGRQADVVENATQLGSWDHLANDVFRLAGNPRRLLDARASLGSQMQAQLAGVDSWKEVLPQTGDEQQACQAKDK